MIVLLAFISTSLSAQQLRSIGVEVGGNLIEKISSSGVDSPNYSAGLNLEYEICKLLSINTGISYNKYGSHTHYTPFSDIPETRYDDMWNMTAYKINTYAIPLTAKINTKFFSLQIGAQGEKTIYQTPTVSVRPLAKEDVDFENYAQENLRAYNVSAIGGIVFKRNFGEKIEMWARPSAQYFFNPIYTNGGFADTNWAYSFKVGANYLLNNKTKK